MTPVRLEPAALRSRIKHSTTEPLRSPWGSVFGPCFIMQYLVSFLVCNHLAEEEKIGCFTLREILVFCEFPNG